MAPTCFFFVFEIVQDYSIGKKDLYVYYKTYKKKIIEKQQNSEIKIKDFELSIIIKKDCYHYDKKSCVCVCASLWCYKNTHLTTKI